jgi:thiol-disulfide isomerase/thioredoxin
MNLLHFRNCIILLLILLGNKSLIAEKLSDSIHFKIELDDTSKITKKGRIVVEYITDHSKFYFFQEREIFEYYLNHRKNVNFAIPRNQVVSYFIIKYYKHNGAVELPFHGDKWYLLMHEEDVLATVSKNGIIFKGKYADYFNCQRDIQNWNKSLPQHITKYMFEATKQDEYLFGLKAYKDSVYLQQKLILEQHKYLFNDTAFKIIDLACRAKASFNLLYEMRYNRQGRWSAARKIISEYLSTREPASELLLSVPYHCDYILFWEYMNISYNSDKNIKAQFHYRKVYDSINRYYSGLLREKLICLFFLYDHARLNKLISDRLTHALSVVKSPRYGAIIKQISTSILTDVSAYPFELRDTHEQLVRLSDFKEKLIVLDFWFEGCMPCMALAKAMIPIKEKYRNNPDVVFININVDKDKEKWLSALLRTPYAENGDINVYTNGEGVNHPMLRHYNFYGFPHQILIDGNGKVIIIDPPRPITVENSQKFIELIKSNLPIRKSLL